MKRILWWVICGTLFTNASAQRSIISSSSIENRARIIREMPVNPGKAEAEQFARRNGIPVRKIDRRGRIIEIMAVEDQRHPLFYVTHNIDAARTVSTNRVWNGGIGGLDLRGNNMLVGVWDGGDIRTTHVEFGNRVYKMDSGFGIVGHATHVAGTIGATGLEPDATGMANKCFIEGYDWNNDTAEMRESAEDGLLISNHSYGYIHGFEFDTDEQRWEWYGDTQYSEKEDYQFGFYGNMSRQWDNIAYDNPYYLIVKSAGNDRLDGPSAGQSHYVFVDGIGWTESTTVRDKDGGPLGYDCIGTQGTAKNILTVGAVRDIERYNGPDDVFMTSFSTFGPTDDGRIKPDIVGNGASLYSTYNESDTDYEYLNGTSMAAPNAAGSLALLQELHFIMFNNYMKASALKGLVLHTANEAGRPGPDYVFGWGLLNTYEAAEFISNDARIILEDSIMDQSEVRYRFHAASDTAARITLSWTDPRGPFIARSVDPEDLTLVNDLDMRLVKLDDSTVYEPYILDPQNPGDPAGKGDNFRDNIEQIHVPLLEEGYYELVITHKNTLTNDLQCYSLIADGMRKVYVAADSTYLDKNNGAFLVTDAPEYPLDRRFVWLIEPVNQQPVSLSFTEFSTDENDLVTLYDGPGATYPVLAQFSGTLSIPDSLVISSGGALFVEFETGIQQGFKGFSARYCTSAPEESLEIIGKDDPCFNLNELYYHIALPETDYSWSFSANVADSARIEQNRVTLLVSQDPFSLAVTPANRCGEGVPSERTIIPATGPPLISLSMEGDTMPCVATPSLFSVENDPKATYRWLIPDEWEGASDSASISVTPGEEPGVLTVIPWNSCGDAEKIELSLGPISAPGIPVIESDRISPCSNSIQEFRVQDQDIISYLWEAETGWEIIGPDSTSNVTVQVGDGTSGRMFLTSSNQCGSNKISRTYLLSPQPSPPDLKLQSSGIEGLDEIVIRNASLYEQISWFRNDNLIPDFRGESLILQRNGVYSVEGANAEGCWASTDASNRIEVDEESLVYNISTGTAGVIKVENDSNQNATIRAFDLTGRMVFTNEIQPGTNLYRTTRKGLLVVRIEGGNRVKTQMIFLY